MTAKKGFDYKILGIFIFGLFVFVSGALFFEGGKGTEEPAQLPEPHGEVSAQVSAETANTSQPKLTSHLTSDEIQNLIASSHNLFHATGDTVMTCSDPKITAEIQDATDHPGTLPDDAYTRIATEGQCSPISPNIQFTVNRIFQFTVAAGVMKEAAAQMTLQDGSHSTFYIMQDNIAPEDNLTPDRAR